MSYHDRYSRGRPGRSSLNPRGQPTRTLTASQIRQIEAAFQEAEEKTAHWEAVATEAQEQSSAWKAKAEELQELATRAQARAAELEAVASTAQAQYERLAADADQWEASLAKAQERAADAEAKLQEAHQKQDEMVERLARNQAEYQNAKKRLERRYAGEAEAKIMRFANDLLPVLDNLDRAIAHEPPPDADNELLLDGLRMTRRSFLAVLAKWGIHPLDAAEQPFDPERHEAMGTVPDPAFPPGTIVDIQQKGYTYRDRLLRPARVLITPL